MSTSNSIQKHVTEAFKQVFPNDQIDHESDFFDLGGDSVALVALCSYLEGHLGFEVHPSLLLYHPTAEELAAELETRSRSTDNLKAAN